MKRDRYSSVQQRVLLFVLPIFLMMTACGTNKGQQSTNTNKDQPITINATVSGVWSGTYAWNCYGTKTGSSPLVLTLTQDDNKISGTAAYLNDVTSLTGSVSGTAVTFQTTGTSTITQNWFLGTAAQNAISGTTVNGEHCSAPSGPSGSFTLTKQAPASGAPDHLALSGPEYVTQGKCSAAFTIESRNVSDSPAAPVSPVTVLLSGGGSGLFYADRNCSQPVSSVAIPGGGTSQNFFFKDPIVENVMPAADDAAGALAGEAMDVSVVGKGGTLTFDLDGSPKDHSTNSQASVEPVLDLLVLWGYDASGNFLNIFVPARAGTFTCNSGVSMYYQTAGRAQWGGYTDFGTCSVTIATIGALGTQVTGSFSGNLDAQFGGAVGTRAIANGQFSIVNGL